MEIVESSQLCEDMLMNFLVSHVTRLAPIKVAQRKSLKDSSSTSSSSFPVSSSHSALTLPSSPYNESSFSVKQVTDMCDQIENGRMDGRTDGWMDGWMEGQTNCTMYRASR